MSSYGLWLSAAGMKVQEHRQTLLANNLANAETTGFKQDLAVVSRRHVESRESPVGIGLNHPVLDNLAGGVNVRPPYKDFSQGGVEGTGRALDAAIDGRGFFVVKDGETTRYTRNGNFTLGADGALVISAGNGHWSAVDETGQVLRLTEGGGAVSISADGTVRQGGETLGRLETVRADDEQKLRKAGEGMYEAGGAVMTPAVLKIVPESLERSNFDVMAGLAEMIEASRAYELNANLIRMQDEATGQAISRVGRVA